MPRGSSSKGKQRANPIDWTRARDFVLSAKSTDINELRGHFDHKDYRLSRAWICFAEENKIGNIMTNHVALKFDFKDFKNQRWFGVKLEAKTMDLEGEEFKDPLSGQLLTAAEVKLGLKQYRGPPRGMRFCVEVETTFNSVEGGTTLGDLISMLSGSQFLRFGFRTKTSSEREEAYVGCRDWLAQVLFALDGYQRIKNSPVKGVDRKLATREQNGNWTVYEKHEVPALFPNIHSVLSVFCEELRAPDGQVYTVVSSSAVEMGCFRAWAADRRRVETGDGYPYQVRYPIGTRSDLVVRPPETNYQGGYGGQGGGYGGGYGGQGGGYGGQGGGYGGDGGGYGGYGSSSGPSMPGPSGYNYYY